MTKEEFENGYAERSGVTVELLAEHGRVAMPCHCGEPCCQGWQMGRISEPCGDELEFIRCEVCSKWNEEECRHLPPECVDYPITINCSYRLLKLGVK